MPKFHLPSGRDMTVARMSRSTLPAVTGPGHYSASGRPVLFCITVRCPQFTDLLSETRPIAFTYGSKEFDPIKLGFAQISGPGTAVLDTRVHGDSNAGHWFTNDTSRPGRIGRAFSDREKFAIIEYLKAATLTDYPTRTVAQPTPPPCANSRQWAIDRLATEKK